MKRKSLSKKLRFEVFKRDKFKCQYCGRPAPEVLLRVDHIEPVSGGGSDEITNLITSCFDCNAGKGATRLSDQATLEKTRQQLEELQEKRNQLEMMMQWRNESLNLDADTLERAADFWSGLLNRRYTLTEHGRVSLKAILRKHGLSPVLDAMQRSVEAYIVLDRDGHPTPESAATAFSKLSGVLAVGAMPKAEQDARYIRGIVKNRFSTQIGGWSDNHRNIRLSELLNRIIAVLDSGFAVESIKREAKTATSFAAFECFLEGLTDASKIS
jgi:hypothetical protein